MLYKYKFRISVFLFVGTLILIGALFGAAVCSDGWASGSIGSSGACSHHGGVSSIPVVVSLIAACFSVISFNGYIGTKYRKHKGFIVKHDLPSHPLESAPEIKPAFILYGVPSLSAKSRKSFQCGMCKINFQSGTVYSYIDQRNRDTKFCLPCSKSIPLANEKTITDRDLYFQTIKINEETVDIYYKKNSVAEVFWHASRQY